MEAKVRQRQRNTDRLMYSKLIFNPFFHVAKKKVLKVQFIFE